MKEDYRLINLYVFFLLEKYTNDEYYITGREIRNQVLKKFGVSITLRTISRYMDGYEYLGIKINKKTEIGKDKEYALAERIFTFSQIEMLADSVIAANFIMDRDSQELVDKLSGLLCENDARLLKKHMHVNGRKKTISTEFFDTIRTIFKAIADNRKIRFRYCIWNKNKELIPKYNGKVYDVSPYFLIWDNDRHYMIGYDNEEKKIKHFRTEKIIGIEMSSDNRIVIDEIKDMSASEYIRTMFGMFAGNIREVEFLCDNNFLNVAIDRFGREHIKIMNTDDGHMKIGVKVSVSEQFFGWYVGIKNMGVKLIGPDDVVDSFKKFIKKIFDCL